MRCFGETKPSANATRWELYRRITDLFFRIVLFSRKNIKQDIGLPVEVGTGGRTKYNRSIRKLPKTHWLDATCIGTSTPEVLKVEGIAPLIITAAMNEVNRRSGSSGHGSRQMCQVDKYGFPRTSAKKYKRLHGFQTGDIVKAIVPTGKKAGTYIGRVAIRSTGSFNIKTKSGTVQGVSYRYCQLLHQIDGYTYEKGESAFLPS